MSPCSGKMVPLVQSASPWPGLAQFLTRQVEQVALQGPGALTTTYPPASAGSTPQAAWELPEAKGCGARSPQDSSAVAAPGAGWPGGGRVVRVCGPQRGG